MADPLITCVSIDRLGLKVAARDRSELLGKPIVIGPEPGGAQLIGDVSVAAEAFGIVPGIRLGEALARCPALVLIPPDPAGVEEHWERLLMALEGIGAGVEPMRPGLACFDARGLLRLHGGTLKAVLEAARRALGEPAHFGVAPTRFAAVAAASRARVRHPLVVTGGQREARDFLASMPVALLRGSPAFAALAEPLERLGIETLGELAALPVAAVADRFGGTGRTAHRLARGQDTPLRPRDPGESLREAVLLHDPSSGTQLERALGILIERLLSRHERRGRTLRTVVLSAALVERGGTWRERVTFREALSDRERVRLALTPRLATLPAPAQELRLMVERFGPPTSDQRALMDDPAEARLARLREAIRQTRAAAGPDAALRVLQIDPGSRFPERRMVLVSGSDDEGAGQRAGA